MAGVRILQVIEDFSNVKVQEQTFGFSCTFILDSVIMAGEYKERKGWIVHFTLTLMRKEKNVIKLKVKNMKKEKEISIIRSSAAEYLTFITATGESDVNAIYFDESVWLAQK